MNNGMPYFYDYTSTVDGVIQPSTVHVTNTGLSRFFQRYLLQKVIAAFEWKVPKTWAKNFFLYVLYMFGYCAIVKTDRFGVVPQICSLRGHNIFYQPTHAVISNRLLRGILEPRIGVQCTLFRLQPDYSGVWDLVSYYGDQMALTAQAFGVNTLNAKLAYFFMTDNDKTAQSIRKVYDNLAKGEPAVVFDKKLFQSATGEPAYKFEQVVGTDVKNIQGLLQVMKQLEIMFDSTIGIPNVSTTKRERELTSEIQANQQNGRALAETWLEYLKQSCEETKEMFGVDITVDWRYPDESVYDSVGNVQVRPNNPGQSGNSRSD